MGKHRLDKRIKEVLEERTIAPSESAWDAVEKQLGNSVESTRQVRWWYGLAAGFAGILLITVFFSSQSGETEVPSGAVVNSDVESVKTPEIQILKEEPEDREDVAVLPIVKTRETITPEEPMQSGSAVMRQELTNQEERGVNYIEELVTAKKLDIKVAEVVAQVSIMEDSGYMVEDEVIDSLLRAAQDQLFKDRIADESAKVDALALLSDVEGELNQSLRDQLFEKLKEGYLKVRTAIAYRND